MGATRQRACMRAAAVALVAALCAARVAPPPRPCADMARLPLASPPPSCALVLWRHLPKAGGTSMRGAFARLYAESGGRWLSVGRWDRLSDAERGCLTPAPNYRVKLLALWANCTASVAAGAPAQPAVRGAIEYHVVNDGGQAFPAHAARARALERAAHAAATPPGPSPRGVRLVLVTVLRDPLGRVASQWERPTMEARQQVRRIRAALGLQDTPGWMEDEGARRRVARAFARDAPEPQCRALALGYTSTRWQSALSAARGVPRAPAGVTAQDEWRALWAAQGGAGAGPRPMDKRWLAQVCEPARDARAERAPSWRAPATTAASAEAEAAAAAPKGVGPGSAVSASADEPDAELIRLGVLEPAAARAAAQRFPTRPPRAAAPTLGLRWLLQPYDVVGVTEALEATMAAVCVAAGMHLCPIRTAMRHAAGKGEPAHALAWEGAVWHAALNSTAADRALHALAQRMLGRSVAALPAAVRSALYGKADHGRDGRDRARGGGAQEARGGGGAAQRARVARPIHIREASKCMPAFRLVLLKTDILGGIVGADPPPLSALPPDARGSANRTAVPPTLPDLSLAPLVRTCGCCVQPAGAALGAGDGDDQAARGGGGEPPRCLPALHIGTTSPRAPLSAARACPMLAVPPALNVTIPSRRKPTNRKARGAHATASPTV